MELEFFCKPGTELEWFAYWKNFCHQWLLGLGMKDENLRLRDHEPEELSHYSNATTDFEFVFPFGWGELWGVASRTDYDLTAHQNTSGKDQTYFDQEENKRYIPYVIEPSLGADRVVLAFLVDAYDEEVVDAEKNDVRTVLRLHPPWPPTRWRCCPEQEAQRQGPGAPGGAEQGLDGGLRRRRLHRQALPPAGRGGHPLLRHRGLRHRGDENTPADNCVTVRERDSMEQVRIPISELKSYLAEKLAY